jgi:mono/diheme cytochrome c family protein
MSRFPSRIAIATSLAIIVGLAASTNGWSQAPAKTPATPDQVTFFENSVRPVFAESCVACHTEGNAGGGLRLDKAVTPAQATAIINRVQGIGGNRMPQGAPPLKDEKLKSLLVWQKNGAVWPEGKAAIDGNLWSLKPIKSPSIPKNVPTGWTAPIDALIAADFTQKGIKPSPVADRATLIKRASLTVTGLPPTYKQVRDFVQNKSPKAYSDMVDSLLASPAFGERMARLWMDIARYADTKGYVFVEDRNYPNAYTYRDWLINAFNSDLPYDQFVIQQLAADKIVSEDRRPLAAMGFLTIGRRFLNAENDIIGDRIDVVTRGFLGLTVQCARCHDHKFDPVPTRDYYSLYSVFASSQEESLTISEKSISDPWNAYNAKLSALKNDRDTSIRRAITRLRSVVATSPDKLSPKVKEALQLTRIDELPQPDRLRTMLLSFEPEEKTNYERLLTEIAVMEKSTPASPEFAMAMTDKQSPVTVNVHKRGNPGIAGEPAPRQFLQCIAGEQRPEWKNSSGRLDLAKSIVDTNNPLTARVYVNRIWMNLFGKGIVRTPSDFGKQGEKPTNGPLLDYLAYTFMHSDGWSTKKLMKRILMSRAFMGSSDVSADVAIKDPENRTFSHQNRRRYDMEQLRDSLLFSSSKLTTTRVGGKSEELWEKGYTARRAVYGFIERQNLPLTFKTLDFASPDASSPMRFVTTVPQQALFMMNSPLVTDQAREIAKAIEASDSKSGTKAVNAAFRSVLGRDASTTELQIGTAFLAKPEVSTDTLANGPWVMGYGSISQTLDRVTDFKKLAVFVNGTYQAGTILPDKDLGWVLLTKDGGHPGSKGVMSIRRFIAPISGTYRVDGTISHGNTQGDGIIARVVSSKKGTLGQWTVYNTKVTPKIDDIALIKGDQLDFVVDCGETPDFDGFDWAPSIKLVDIGLPKGQKRIWLASDGFSESTAPKVLSRLEQFIHALLMSNEFVTID